MPSFLLILIVIISTFQLAHADDVFDLSLEELQSIKVEVASLFEDDILDIASSTAVLHHSDWQNRNASTLGQALEAVPSVFANTIWGGSEVIAIRGYATELSVRGVSYTIDNLPLGTYTYANTGYAIPRMPLPLMQQVEMIRGPGSALYGSDAFHGVLAFKLANEPISHSTGQLQLGTNKQQVNLLNTQISEHWQINSGIAYEQDGPHDPSYQYTNPNTGEIKTSQRKQSMENISAYVKATHGSISGHGKWSSLLFYNTLKADGFQGLGQQFFIPFSSLFDLKSTSLTTDADTTDGDSRFLLTGLSHEIRFHNAMQLKNQVYFWRSEHQWAFDNRGLPDTLTTLSGNILPCKTSVDSTSSNPLFCQHVRTQRNNEQRSGYQVQLKQRYSPLNTQWILGAGHDQIKITNSRFERRDINNNVLIGANNDFQGDSRHLSHLLAQARTGFQDNRWLLSYGLRWDNYSDADDHVSPRLGLVHKINKQWRQKLLYSHAYRAPTAVELKGSSASLLGNVDLKSETIDTYEYVLMYQQPNFQLEGVFFASEWEDAIALVPVSNFSNTNRYQNIKNNHAQGIEISATKLINSWTLKTNISHVRSENKDDNIDYQAFPKTMLSLNSEKKITERSTLGIWYRHMRDYALGDDTVLFSDRDQQYHRFDLYASHRFSHHTKVGMSVYNLFDQSLPLPSYYGSEDGWQDLGRQINVYLEQHF